ncbi:bone morphogenetic protein 5-like [Argonauta hians]
MQLRLALIKDNILKYLGLSSVPNIKDPSIPQIPTVQHAINEHAMQKDSPFHTGRKLDFDNEFVGHTLRPLQRIMVSYPLTNFSFPNLTNTFQFSLKLLPYMYSIKKAILWLYLRPVLTSAEEGFTVLEVNCLSTNKSLRARKVKLERNSEGKGKWYTFDTTKIVKKRLIAKEGHIQMQAMAHSKQGTNQLVLLSDNQEDRGYKPYLEIQMVPNRRKRSKRGVGLQCDATKLENRCCLYPMEVTFADFGWNWIIIPSTYRANYCSGECDIKLLQDYAHTSMVSNLKQNSSQIICCTPTALSSLSLLYFNDDADIEQRDLPNMIVDSCGCR